MEKLNWIKFILVFVTTGLGDMFWTLYIRRTSEGKAALASLYSALLMITGGLVVITYVENKWYLVPAALGAFLGTYVTVKWDAKHPEK